MVKSVPASEQTCVGIHHPGLVVTDIAVAIEFYGRALGAELVKHSSWPTGSAQFDRLTGLQDSAAEFCLMRLGASYLEIFQYDSSKNKEVNTLAADELGIRHLAFEVADLDLAEKHLLSAGGSPLGNPVHVPAGGSARYYRDPFGNILELLVAGGTMPSIASNSP